MWTALAVVLVVLLGLVALVLFTPLEVTFRCERRPTFRYRFGFVWLFGLVDTEFTPESERDAAVGEPTVPAKAKPRRRRGRRRQGQVHVLAMLSRKGFLPGAARLLARLVRAFRFQDLHLWLRAGLDDPADTGLLCAWILPAAAYLEGRHPGRLDVQPVFEEPAFAFTTRGRVSVTPARLLGPLLLFGTSPSTIRGLVALRRGR